MTVNISPNAVNTAPRRKVYRFPASSAQRRLWFLDRLESGGASYNIPGALRIQGLLDVKSLEKSLQEIVRRHESLRTRFMEVQGEPYQIVDAEAAIELQVTDLGGRISAFAGISSDDVATENAACECTVRKLAEEESRKPFDLRRGPLLRVKLLRLGADEHVLLLTMHHIISDGWSVGVLVREVSLLYAAFVAGRPSPLPELPIQYGDYSVWQQEWMREQMLERQLSYWRKQLAGVMAWELPTDWPRPEVRSQRGATLEFTVSAGMAAKLKELSQRQGVTLFMTMLAAWEVLLYRYSGQQDLTVGTPIAGRTRTETEGLIGFFVNTLVLRGDLSGRPNFTQLLQRVRHKTLEAYAHQDVPFERLVEELQPERDQSRSPLFQVMFVLQNAPTSELELGGVKLQLLNVESTTAKFDLTLGLTESTGQAEGGMRGLLEYSTDLFEKASIGRMIGHYQTLLEAVLGGREQAIEELRMLPEAERHQVLHEWSKTGLECLNEQYGYEMFEEQVKESNLIGARLTNSEVYVLDKCGGVVPVGVPGELHLAGDELARGYLSRPELTAEKFVPNPFSGVGGERLYRTGDRAKWRDGGKLEFLGRCEALAEPEKREAVIEETGAPVFTPTEELIAGMWSSLLGKSDIRRDHNFFDLGGHSLLVTQVISRIREVFHVELPLQVMFETPTVAELARSVENSRRIEAPPLLPRSRPQRLPLSFGQERLRFLGRFDRETSAYNIPVALRLRGALNVDVARASLQEIVARHEALRTSFPEVGDSTIQNIASEMEMPFAVSETSEDELDQVLREQARQSFDLSHGPLIRASLFRITSQDHVLLVVFHHIVSDGWSLGVMLREFNVLYDAFSRGVVSPLPPLPIQYADYSEWQREWLQGEVLERQLEYWRKQLAGVKAWDHPIDWPRPVVRSQRGATLEFTLSPETTARLKELSQRRGVTLFMTMLAAWEVLLYRYSGQQDLTVGTPIAGRTRTETEGLIGFFVNTLVLRGDLSGRPSFTELLQRLRHKTLEAYAHQDVPFERLVEELQPERDVSRSPLFPVLFVMQNAPMSDFEMEGVNLQVVNVDSETAKFDMTLGLSESWEVDGEIKGSLEYSTDLFEKASIGRMIGHYQTLLKAVVSGSEESIEELRILPDAERDQVLYSWNETRVEFRNEQCVHEMFEEQAERTPQAVAVEYEERELTYDELNRRANQLAHYLRELGVEPDARVAVCTEYGFEAIIGLLAILKAGGACVPLDSTYPNQRLNYMLADSAPMVLLTQGHLENLFGLSPTLPVIDLPQAADLWHDRPAANLDRRGLGLTPRHLAYIHYTSNSSGPKGVMVEHGALQNAIKYLQQEFGGGPGNVWLVPNTLASDITEFEVHLPLTMGATLRLSNTNSTLHVESMVRDLDGITGLFATPASCRSLLDHKWPETEEIKVLCSNENLSADLVDKLLDRNADVRNSYGTPEITTYSIIYKCDKAAKHPMVPIGRPTANMRAYILDGQGEPVPIGVPGELYMGGTGVARGYLNRPELTAERFLEDEFAKESGARMYRTGDWGRWLPDGDIEFLGRNDLQVNILGFRVELGEIEKALMTHPKVQEAAVVAVQDKAGDKRLVAYYTRRESNEPDEDIAEAEELRNQLMVSLPEYMMPAEYVHLERMPLTTNGKLDRTALPSPGGEKHEAPVYEAPVGEIEATLAAIWAELLKVERVGRYDDFFALGGHSLLVTAMRSMIHEQLRYDLPLDKLFYNPCIAELATQLEQIPEQRVDQPQPQLPSLILVEIQPRGFRTPFFCVHPVGGQVVCYADLANELGVDRPFYGLQAPALSSYSDPTSTVEQMATLYNQEVRRTQLIGPYLVGGWSLGGLVAYEMARQLHEEGHLVGLVALFDTHLPARQPETAGQTKVTNGRHKQNMLARFALDLARVLGKDVSDLREGFLQLGYEQQFKFIQEMLICEGMLSQHAARDEMTNLLEVFSRNSAAMDNYSLRPSEQPVVLFAAADNEQPSYLREDWELRTGHSVNFRQVPGHHYTILRKPHVSILAKLLEDVFESVNSEDHFALARDRK